MDLKSESPAPASTGNGASEDQQSRCNPKPNLTRSQNQGRIFGRNDVTWRGDALFVGGSRTPAAHIVPDAVHPGMWRVKLPTGITDMVNRTRARDAAVTRALAAVNSRYQETALGGPPVRQNGGAVPEPPPDVWIDWPADDAGAANG